MPQGQAPALDPPSIRALREPPSVAASHCERDADSDAKHDEKPTNFTFLPLSPYACVTS
jgi:hypothetical protein